jgi:hypothetical protein
MFIASSVFPAEIDNSNGNGNRSVNNTSNEGLPYGFIFLKKGAFDGLINQMSDQWELDQLLGFKSSEYTNEFDWQRWLQSRNSGDSRLLLGGLPFISIPKHNRQDDEHGDPTFFSSDKFFFFWYFKQKF